MVRHLSHDRSNDLKNLVWSTQLALVAITGKSGNEGHIFMDEAVPDQPWLLKLNARDSGVFIPFLVVDRVWLISYSYWWIWIEFCKEIEEAGLADYLLFNRYAVKRLCAVRGKTYRMRPKCGYDDQANYLSATRLYILNRFQEEKMNKEIGIDNWACMVSVPEASLLLATP